MTSFPKEFKEAISHLPSTKKDKLILRLLKKDLVLANRLHFELLSTNTVDEQRRVLEKRIKERVKRITETFYSIGYLNVDVRYLSGEINEHVQITKDKYGEVSLNILLLNEVLKLNKSNILKSTSSKAIKFCTAVIARVFKILILINKIDSDYLLDFKKGINELGVLISENHHLMNASIINGLDVNWLLKADIPENIVEIHKKIRALGFLK